MTDDNRELEASIKYNRVKRAIFDREDDIMRIIDNGLRTQADADLAKGCLLFTVASILKDRAEAIKLELDLEDNES